MTAEERRPGANRAATKNQADTRASERTVAQGTDEAHGSTSSSADMFGYVFLRDDYLRDHTDEDDTAAEHDA